LVTGLIVQNMSDMTYLLNGHDNLHGVEGIETEVVGEVG